MGRIIDFFQTPRWFHIIIPTISLFFVQELTQGPLQTLFQQWYNDGEHINCTSEENTELCNELNSKVLNALGLLRLVAAMCAMVCSPILGRLSDAFGRRKLFLFPALLQILPPLGLLLYQFTNFSLYFYWVTYPLAYGINLTPSLLGYIGDTTKPIERARVYGYYIASILIPFILGPLIGNAVPFEYIFIITLACAVITFVYLIFLTPESLLRENRQIFTLSMLNPFSSFPILRRFAFLAAATLFFCIPAEGILQTLFVYNEDQFHPTPQMNSIVLASFGMGSVVMLLLIHPLKKIFDDRQLCIIGFAIQAVFCALLGVAWNVYIVLGATIFIGCASIAFPAISAIKANGVSASEQGQVQGALYGLRMIGTGVGPYIFAYTYSAFRDPHGSFPAVPGMPFYIGSGIGLIAVVCGYFVPKKLPSPADYATPITVDNNEFGAKLLDESFDSLSISSSYKDDIVLSNRTFPQLDSDDEYYPPAVMSLTSGPPVSGAAII